jgi:hypothetical protein
MEKKRTYPAETFNLKTVSNLKGFRAFPTLSETEKSRVPINNLERGKRKLTSASKSQN